MVFLGFQTTQFNRVWKNTELFWTSVIEEDFYNEIAHYNLGLYIHQSEATLIEQASSFGIPSRSIPSIT